MIDVEQISIYQSIQPVPAKKRFVAIDILRGAVMLIMTLGHVRHFLHLPALVENPTDLETTTPALFFTRWVSHYCAATFVFLAGISIFIVGQGKEKKHHSNFIVKRGFWLVIVELLIVAFGMTFDPLYHTFILQVIWATGWSMVMLGLLMKVSWNIILLMGCILFFGHNALDYIRLPQEGVAGLLWKAFFTSDVDTLALGSNRTVLLIYAILPWTGIMFLGYSFGALYKRDFDAAVRKKILTYAGIALTVLFIVLRFINEYGDPAPWSHQKNGLFTLLSFLNVTKYPVSLQYGCMTLGPVLLILASIERCRGQVADFLSVFGKVPFFFYVLHFYLIHIVLGILFFATGHTWEEAIHGDSPFLFRPLNFGVGLGAVYLIWLLIIPALYFPCRWFVQYKKTNRQWWLRYL